MKLNIKRKYLVLAGIQVLIWATLLSLYKPKEHRYNTEIAIPNTWSKSYIDFSEYPFIHNALLERGVALYSWRFLQNDLDQIGTLWLKIPKHSIKTLDMLTFKPFSNLTELSLTNLNEGKSIIWDRYIAIINFDKLTSLKSFSAMNLPLNELDVAKLPPQLKKISIYGVGMQSIKNKEFFDHLNAVYLDIDISGACKKYRYPEVKWNDIWCEE